MAGVPAERREGVSDHLLEQVGEEIAVPARYGADYGYTEYVLRPRG